jgi:hypothetical protein
MPFVIVTDEPGKDWHQARPAPWRLKNTRIRGVVHQARFVA